MHKQTNHDNYGNDVIMTPEYLAKSLIKHFNPSGVILEPCRGTGNFYNNLPNGSLWCELSEGRDFLEFNQKVDWIITNPPWSKMRKFLQHSMDISDNVAFLCTINHLWIKARIRDMKERGFGIKEIVIFKTPTEFEFLKLGFQMGMFHLQRGYIGDIKFTDLNYEVLTA